MEIDDVLNLQNNNNHNHINYNNNMDGVDDILG
jgi:hypothetical protein